MKPNALYHSVFAACLLSGSTLFAGESGKTVAPPADPGDDHWKFMLSMPGWIAGVTGDTGLHGITSSVDVSPGDVIRHIDMVATFRGEVSKGRFGITADFLYLSLSDGIGTDTVVKKLDVQFDQILGDLGFRWRVIESPRGWLDVTAGVRYTNLFQQLVTQPNSERINEVSGNIVDAVSEGLRTALSNSQIGEIVASRIKNAIPTPDSDRSGIPIGPLGGRENVALRKLVERAIEQRRVELQAAVQAAQQAVGAAKVQAEQRVSDIKKDISRKIARTLEDKLDARVARTDDWFDPYVGLRARYNFNARFYVTAKGDVGGFGVGSKFTWQAEAALGCNLTPNIFAEAGYRALGVDYEGDGLTYDMITHGAQITLGINF